MALIEVNPDSKTAPQDRSCEAASFHHDGIICCGVQNSAICCTREKYFSSGWKSMEVFSKTPFRAVFCCKSLYRRFYDMTITDLHFG